MAAMKSVAWMTMGSVASWLLAMTIVPHAPRTEWLAGMLGPLVAVAISWVAIERAHRRDASQVGAVLLVAFPVKALFFAGYVAVMLRGFAMRPVPFIVSFTCYFVALYAVEALLLQRLSSRGLRGAPVPGRSPS
jgi:hypothetical protein